MEDNSKIYKLPESSLIKILQHRHLSERFVALKEAEIAAKNPEFKKMWNEKLKQLLNKDDEGMMQ